MATDASLRTGYNKSQTDTLLAAKVSTADIGNAETAAGAALNATYGAGQTTRDAARRTKRLGAGWDGKIAETLGDVTVGALVDYVATPSTVPSSTDSWSYNNGGGYVNPALRILGCEAVQSQVTFPRYRFIKPDPTIITYAPGPATGTRMTVETDYAGAAIDVLLRYNADTVHKIYVDGFLVTKVNVADQAAAGTTAGNLTRVPLTFTTAKRRRITVELGGEAEFAGFTINSSYPLTYPADGPAGPRVMFIGDSFTEGTGRTSGDAYGDEYVTHAAHLLGWRDAWKCGSGSTGYYTDGTRLALIDRYADDVIGWAPNIVVFAMGINDEANYGSTPGAVQAAWQTVWDDVAADLPDAELIVVGPWPNGGGVGVTATLTAMDAAMKADAIGRGLQYVSPISEGLTFTRSDTTHPDAAGYRKIGRWLAGFLADPHAQAA